MHLNIVRSSLYITLQEILLLCTTGRRLCNSMNSNAAFREGNGEKSTLSSVEENWLRISSTFMQDNYKKHY